MQKDLIQQIIKNKIPCVIVSPHFDDSVLSCGELLSKISGKTDITVVNVFTKAHKKYYTLSARKFLMESGINDATKLYDERLLEDKKALANFKVKIINLGLEDAIFRLKQKPGFLARLLPEFGHVYPTYQWHVVKGIASDDPALTELQDALKKLIKKDTIVFAPYAIGHHVDHQIVRNVCETLFTNLILYSDFPYNIRNGIYGTISPNTTEYILPINYPQKEKVIRMYKTQMNGLFPDGKIPEHEERYFINKQL